MDPVQIGGSVISAAPYTVSQLIAPTANVNGIVIRTACIVGAKYSAFLSVGTKAPSGTNDASVPAILVSRGNIASASGYPGCFANLPYPLVIPAGQGLWVASDVSDDVRVYVTYDPVA